MIAPAPRQPRRTRAGFTLVEMLVAVALVSLMMVLFAQVFTLAGNSVSTQKGIARNDQRARTVMNMLRNDLQDRTFRTVVPFADGEPDPGTGPLWFENRRGYFYISENDPTNPTDDVLQLVIKVDQDDPITGIAQQLTPADDTDNEPDADDGEDGNGVGSSQFAVVSYWVRHGVLYRRVLLIRQPPSGMAHEPDQTPAGPSFYANFDYDAHHDGTQIVWHGQSTADDWLDNSRPTAVAIPNNRFGHEFTTGRPREFDSNTTLRQFIGRYTHDETSSNTFRYPLVGTTSPYALATNVNVANGRVVEYAGGSRRGEDILMQNVHEFDIKVFDDAAGDFVDIGGTGAVDFATGQNQNPAYASNANGTNGRNIFDTWHPGLGADPPYRPSDTGGPKALTVIQIRLRFFDNDSEQHRQMTLRQALVPES